MATITLYSGKINQMSSLINKAKTSVKSYKSDLKSLKSKVLSIDESICDVDDVISSIKSSTKTQEDKIETLENLKQDINDFISDVVRIDGDAADAINKSKDDFYDKYEYLKPECEKSGWEKFKDGCKKVGEWCQEHWKEILAIAVVITGVVLCFVPGLNWLGSGILIGSLKGALSGGLIGGLSSWASGGSFWEGFKDGVVTGAIFGGVFGGLGAAGEFLGNAKAVSLLAIEKIKSGDKVISTDPETMKTSPKTVLETYIREVTTLVHLTVNGEEIITTIDHPFYVKDKGFVTAGELKIGDELLDANGNVLLVENFDVELTEKPVTVYNFQVDEFHTYHVGELGVLVHNAEKYGNGHYDNNPSDNPKVLADAEEDPNAVYGYKPKKDGSLKNFANEDWSDPEFVESARQKRIQYIEDDRSICDLVSDMKNKGCSTEEIAHSICDYRNQTRLNSYLDLDGNIINENGYNAALERMQTRSYDALISSGKTPEQIISSSMRTNPAMDACVGLYDENFNSY